MAGIRIPRISNVSVRRRPTGTQQIPASFVADEASKSRVFDAVGDAGGVIAAEGTRIAGVQRETRDRDDFREGRDAFQRAAAKANNRFEELMKERQLGNAVERGGGKEAGGSDGFSVSFAKEMSTFFEEETKGLSTRQWGVATQFFRDYAHTKNQAASQYEAGERFKAEKRGDAAEIVLHTDNAKNAFAKPSQVEAELAKALAVIDRQNDLVDGEKFNQKRALTINVMVDAIENTASRNALKGANLANRWREPLGEDAFAEVMDKNNKQRVVQQTKTIVDQLFPLWQGVNGTETSNDIMRSIRNMNLPADEINDAIAAMEQRFASHEDNENRAQSRQNKHDAQRADVLMQAFQFDDARSLAYMSDDPDFTNSLLQTIKRREKNTPPSTPDIVIRGLEKLAFSADPATRAAFARLPLENIAELQEDGPAPGWRDLFIGLQIDIQQGKSTTQMVEGRGKEKVFQTFVTLNIVRKGAKVQSKTERDREALAYRAYNEAVIAMQSVPGQGPLTEENFQEAMDSAAIGLLKSDDLGGFWGTRQVFLFDNASFDNIPTSEVRRIRGDIEEAGVGSTQVTNSMIFDEWVAEGIERAEAQ